MSYELVQGLKIKKDEQEVWIKASSNNVEPKTYYWEEIPGLTAQLREHGEDHIHKVVLYMYWQGVFQPGAYNNYYKAVAIFKQKNPKLNWDSVGEYSDVDLMFGDLEDLPKYLGTDKPHQQRIIKHRLNGHTYEEGKDVPLITMTIQQLKDELLSIYKGYRKDRIGFDFIFSCNLLNCFQDLVYGSCLSRADVKHFSCNIIF